MDKIARVRRKIKELRELLEDHNYYLDNSEQALGYGLALDDIENFLDTLSEEPSKSLEEAAEEYAKGEGLDTALGGWEDMYDAFIAGAERQKQHDAELIEIAYNDGITIGMTKQKQQMLKDAVEALVITYENSSSSSPGASCVEFVTNIPALHFRGKDKVRIVVLKEEEDKR